MKIYIVVELIYGNEGNPNILAFVDRKARDAAARKLKAENDDGEGLNPGVLIVRQTLTVEGA